MSSLSPDSSFTPLPPEHKDQGAYGRGRTAEWRDAGAIQIELRAYNSLASGGARVFLVSVAIGPLLTAGFCVTQGFWPVLPFAGLELALRWSMRRGQQRETITITEDFVTIAAQSAVNAVNMRFPRHWSRVKLLVPKFGQERSRLYLESGGRLCELGSFLTDDERRGLVPRLQELVGNMNSSPALH